MLEQRDRKLLDRERELDKTARGAVAKAHQEQVAALERVSGVSADDAKALLLEAVREEAEHDAVKLARSIERKARDEADEKARDIVVTAIQRVAADHTAEHTVTVVHLPNDEMKGRIIGREGRNIRALEQATGVDLIIDDTPESVVLSGFDPVRREVARVALTKLIGDGRIHPGRIEEVVAKARAEVDLIIRQAGETAAYEAGVPGPAAGAHQAPRPAEVPHELRPERPQPLDRDRAASPRSSRPRSAPTSRSPRWAACSTTSARPSTTRSRARTPRSAPRSPSATTCRRRSSTAIAAHHQEVEYACLEAPIVQIADAISASRPGARGETMDTYVKRLEDLQAIADSFQGVERSFAVQAGREVRILVRPEEIDDLTATRLARDIVRKIEEQLTYPGQIKVTVIRETRAVEYAK